MGELEMIRTDGFSCLDNKPDQVSNNIEMKCLLQTRAKGHWSLGKGQNLNSDLILRFM